MKNSYCTKHHHIYLSISANNNKIWIKEWRFGQYDVTYSKEPSLNTGDNRTGESFIQRKYKEDWNSLTRLKWALEMERPESTLQENNGVNSKLTELWQNKGVRY